MKKQIQTTVSLLVLSSSLLLCCLSSCKKASHSAPKSPGGTDSAFSLSDEDSLKYYLYRYMEVTITTGADSVIRVPQYFWYSQVPALDPLSAAYSKAEDLLNTIISYAHDNTSGKALDHYSFLDRTGQVANQIQNGLSGGGLGRLSAPSTSARSAISGDMGFIPGYADDNQGNPHLFVMFVYRNSSAGLQGVQRGWEITAINGNTDISNTTALQNALFNSPSASFSFLEPDGSRVTLTIDATIYSLNPVLFDTIYQVSGIPVGYFVFNQFLDVYDANGNPTETKTELDQVFHSFQSAGVRDMIVDERYNGGGSVSTAEYLDSLYAPASAAGRLMYRYTYNDKMTQYAANLGLIQQVNFGPVTGGLNLDHIFFITTRNTVSASELTMMNLKPYMDVKQVGDTSYGKPVGFFDWSIDDHDSTGKAQHLADLFDVNFATFNANGQGGYFQGIPPDQLAGDYINLNWGDPNDQNLSDIFSFIATGSFRQSQARLAVPGNIQAAIPRSVPTGQFQGMVDFRPKLRLH